MKESIGTILRTLLKVGGGWFIASGIADEAQVEAIIGAIVTIFGIVWGIVAAKQAAKDRQVLHPNEKSNLSGPLMILFCASALVGCARFTTTQTDVSYENGKPFRAITTRAAAITFFEAKSALAQFKASQTDKTQTATVGSLNQESSATNAANAAGEFLGALIKAAQ